MFSLSLVSYALAKRERVKRGILKQKRGARERAIEKKPWLEATANGVVDLRFSLPSPPLSRQLPCVVCALLASRLPCLSVEVVVVGGGGQEEASWRTRLGGAFVEAFGDDEEDEAFAPSTAPLAPPAPPPSNAGMSRREGASTGGEKTGRKRDQERRCCFRVARFLCLLEEEREKRRTKIKIKKGLARSTLLSFSSFTAQAQSCSGLSPPSARRTSWPPSCSNLQRRQRA